MKKPSMRTMKSLVNRYYDESLSLELTLANMLDMVKGFGPLEQAMLLAPHIETMLERERLDAYVKCGKQLIAEKEDGQA